MTVDIDLSGKTAIVTGAGRNIGQAIAEMCGDADANVVAASRTQSEIDSTIQTVTDRGGSGIAVPTDLTKHEELEQLIETTVREFGAPHILINNAGVNPDQIEDELADFEAMVSTNFKAPLFLSRLFAEEFRTASLSEGRIINVSSIGGHLGINGMTLYSGTKAGLYGLTRGLAAELASDGITVNSVSPGLANIPRNRQFLDEFTGVVFSEEGVERIPLGRMGECDEIANACLLLASDHSSYITGEDLRVDGGVCFTAGLYK